MSQDQNRALAQARFETLHRELNAGVPAGRIALRKGYEFAIEETAREAFEAFCFRYLEMRTEFDFFLKTMANKKALLDVGSLFGIFAMVFTRRPGTAALAVEPSPLALPVLRRNLALNPDLNVRVVDVAASDTEGHTPMAFEWAHVVARPKGARSPGEQIVSIRSRRIDDFIGEAQFKPDLVKIDVEGYETQVLRGMTDLLDQNGPDIHLELHGQFLRNLGSSVEEVIEFLIQRGYKLFDMAGEPIPMTPEVFNLLRQLGFFHIFASKDPAASKLWS
jgi:FkbM family methyltransferase